MGRAVEEVKGRALHDVLEWDFRIRDTIHPFRRYAFLCLIEIISRYDGHRSCNCMCDHFTCEMPSLRHSISNCLLMNSSSPPKIA